MSQPRAMPAPTIAKVLETLRRPLNRLWTGHVPLILQFDSEMVQEHHQNGVIGRLALCGLGGCQNRPAPFPVRMCRTRWLIQALSVLSLSLDFFRVCPLCWGPALFCVMCYLCDSTSASDWERLVSEMTCNVLMGTLNHTHSLTHSLTIRRVITAINKYYASADLDFFLCSSHLERNSAGSVWRCTRTICLSATSGVVAGERGIILTSISAKRV